jgi:hypothetical protein
MYHFSFFGENALLVLALFGLLTLFFLRRWLERSFERIAAKTSLCLLSLALLPIALRLALLPHHPAPTPEVYEEFSHLLVADTLFHFRLANPPNALPQFFETSYVLQQPTYSSICPIGQGLVLAIGSVFFGHIWAGVLLCTAAFCSLSYWMLRGWMSPAWSLIGGMLAVFEFGPLNEWTNCYWGGGLSAVAGCLVFGALPRIRDYGRKRDAACLGAGIALEMLTSPVQSIFLLLSVPLFFLPVWRKEKNWRAFIQPVWVSLLVALPAIGLTLLQNRQVTGSWTTLPYEQNQVQYGVPVSLTFQPLPVPQRPLTRQQEQEYEAESLLHGKCPESINKFLLRLQSRVRYAGFFFLPPLYLAMFGLSLHRYRFIWIALTIVIFVLGTNFFPYFLPSYIAATTCLFLLATVAGLQQLARFQSRSSAVGFKAASVILLACTANFTFWWSLHLTEDPSRPLGLPSYATWDLMPHPNSRRHFMVNEQLTHLAGKKQVKMLVFVRYWPNHRFQDEWVYTSAEISHAPIIWARDLGLPENKKLMNYYPGRKTWLLEPDADPPKLRLYETNSIATPLP